MSYEYSEDNLVEQATADILKDLGWQVETAWTNDDNKVIYAMKRGLELILTGESTRGTITNDIYTLKGFTNALNLLNKDC